MTKLLLTFLLSITLLAAATANFDAAATGQAPAGWTIAMTSKGGAPHWEVRADPSAPSGPNVLAQTSDDATRGRFPLAVYDKVTTTNGKVSVKFRPLTGKIDQAGGLVWRYRDENNYYVVRANALEDNVVLYKVDRGKRSSLAPKGAPPKTYGVPQEVPANTWSTLAVTFAGNLFTVYFNGKKLFDVEDDTFSNAGKVGMWTKADSVTNFDDFEVVGQ